MRKRVVIRVIVYILLAFFVAVAVGPFFLITRTSLQKTLTLTGSRNPEYTLYNYANLLTKTKYLHWMLNSIIFAAGVTLVKIVIDTFAGYAFARHRFPGSRFLFAFVLITMMMPFAVAMFPVFMIVARFKLTNTYFGLILPMLANPFGIFLMRQFIVTIPREIDESARIDGCPEMTLLFRIIMPLSRPGQAVLAIIMFMWQWTNLIWPLIVTNTAEMFTLTVGLAGIPSQHTIDWGLLTSGALLSVLPIIIFFLIYQKGFIEGLTLGAVKG
jgi:ABC-type glycerol-3-phosphate transport system permease component